MLTNEKLRKMTFELDAAREELCIIKMHRLAKAFGAFPSSTSLQRFCIRPGSKSLAYDHSDPP